MGFKNNRLKKKIASQYITDKNTIAYLSKNIEDIENFEYAVKLSCSIINQERVQQFYRLACDINLLKSDYYKQALEVFIKYMDPKISKEIKCILSENIIINSPFYPAVLELLNINCSIKYISNVIYNLLIENIIHITPSLFNSLIHFKESTNVEIYMTLNNPLINKEKFINMLDKLNEDENSNNIEENINKILFSIRRILSLDDNIAIKELLNFLYDQTNNIKENYNHFDTSFQNKIIEQHYQIAERRSLK